MKGGEMKEIRLPMILCLGLLLVVSGAILFSSSAALAQDPVRSGGASIQPTTGTAFTYQGQLLYNGAPKTSTCRLVFILWDAETGGTNLATTNSVVAIQNGLFSTEVDFGENVFQGNARWMSIRIQCPVNYGPWTDLAGRIRLNAAPYALALPGLWTQQNTVSPNIIGGYSGNNVTAGVQGATIGGGGEIDIVNSVTDDFNTVGGGEGNIAGNSDGTTWNAGAATVGGGLRNVASGQLSTIGGGNSNMATGDFTTVAGGGTNVASGHYGTVPGGYGNRAAGRESFAAGDTASAMHEGTFVWDGNTDIGSDLNSSAAGQFIARAPGGFWFGSTSGNITATIGSGVLINTSTGANLDTGGTWNNASDRNLKENFTPVDSQAVLEKVVQLPLTSWNYKAQSARVRHVGPVAQDFYAAFGLGQDDRHISTVDTAGISLAAIQALYAQNQELRAENANLRSRLAGLEVRLSALEAARGGGK